ncbi:MAG: hypothetical protein DRQ62_10025, partial [Gammaproteobacteria bacterium]
MKKPSNNYFLKLSFSLRCAWIKALQAFCLFCVYSSSINAVTYVFNSSFNENVDAARSACDNFVDSLGYTGVAGCALPGNDARKVNFVYTVNLCADGYPGQSTYNCGHDDTNFTRVSAYFYFPHYSLGDNLEENSKQCNKVGNPINPVTGDKFQVETLIYIDAVQPLIIDLIYNSSSLSKWSHSYNRRLTFSNLPTGTRYDTVGSANGFYPTATPEISSNFGVTADDYGKQNALMLNSSKLRHFSKDAACEDGWSIFRRNYQYSWKSTAVAKYQITAISSFGGVGQCYIYDAPDGDLKMVLDIYELFNGTPVDYENLGVSDLFLRFQRENGDVIVFTHYDEIVNKSKSGETLEIIGTGTDKIYRLHTINDEIEEYSSDGIVSSIISAQGHVQILSYVTDSVPSFGLLNQVSNQTGESLTFDYESYGDDGQSARIKSIRDNADRVWVFNYDPDELTLSSVGMPDGTTKLYHYENQIDKQLLTG